MSFDANSATCNILFTDVPITDSVGKYRMELKQQNKICILISRQDCWPSTIYQTYAEKNTLV
jgi:hypothetical protein